jgi:hypothetical protein
MTLLSMVAWMVSRRLSFRAGGLAPHSSPAAIPVKITQTSALIPMSNIMITFHASEDYSKIKLVQRESREESWADRTTLELKVHELTTTAVR